jgi:peptidoglycan/LPS O-acetylase OafA/YrhL
MRELMTNIKDCHFVENNFSLDANANDTSILLDFLRWTAAQAVCVGHALNFFGVGDALRPPEMPYMQNIGVLIFFVLSGFLIAHALVRVSIKERPLVNFVIDRFSRIYSAFIPSLILIALIDLSLVYLNYHGQPAYVTLKIFLGNVLMLQNLEIPWFGALPSFGSAGQLWTLSVEWHIYIFVGGLFFFLQNKSRWLGLIFIVLFSYVPLSFFGESRLDETGYGLSYLWLLGFASYFLIRSDFVKKFNVLFLVFLLICLVYFWGNRLVPGKEYNISQYPILAAIFTLSVLVTQSTKAFVDKFIVLNLVRKLADYSFTLYLVHYSILYAIYKIYGGGSLAVALISILICNIVAYFLAIHTELKYRLVGAYIKNKLGLR